jgi:hypothetical protein
MDPGIKTLRARIVRERLCKGVNRVSGNLSRPAPVHSELLSSARSSRASRPRRRGRLSRTSGPDSDLHRFLLASSVYS